MEYLNIDYHVKRLLLIAIAKYKTKPEQAKALGVSERTLTVYFKKYQINYIKEKNKNNEKKQHNAITR